MVLVKPLHDIQCLLGRIAVALVGFSLQRSQIIQGGRISLLCFLLNLGNVDLISCIFPDCIDFCFVKSASGIGLRISPGKSNPSGLVRNMI